LNVLIPRLALYPPIVPVKNQEVFFLMSTNLFVGNLSFRVTEDELQTLFSNQGEVIKVRIIKDRESGLSRGFGFVEMSDSTQAANAIRELNGYEIFGRAMRVNEAQAKTEAERPPRRDMDKRFNNRRPSRYNS
jgi:cold-inducible RNA-binding protein